MAKKQQSVYHIKVKGLNEIKSLNTEISKLNGQYDKLSKESKKASDSTKNVGKSSKDSSGGLSKMAKGAAVAGAALVAFNKISKLVTQQMKQAVEVFKGFEFEMVKVKAISGANDAEFKKLNKTSQELGRSTFFTAQQVAALQLNFSKLGFTASEVLDVQEAALLTATATGEDLARTATVIGSTIRGFGLDATEGARVADTMAASFTQSALTLEKFQTSMTKVSSVAALLGFDLEETTAIMGVLTDAGIEASIAGTSLRNIFLKLGDPSSDLAKSIGFTVNSSEDMVREFRRMRDEGVNVEKMLKIVDVRQVQAIANMVKHIDKIEEQTESYRNSSGAAGEMAGIIGDSLQGATLRFQSALDGLRIVLVEKIGKNLQNVIDKFAVFFNLLAKSAETPLSEELDKQRIALIAYESKLLDVNTSEQERFKIIEKLKESYPDYLGHLDAEKTKNDELKLALKNANAQLLNKILLQKEDEKISEQAEKTAERMARVIERENIVREEMAKIIEKQRRRVDEDDFGVGIRIANQTYFTLKEGMSLEEQALDLLNQMDAYTVKGTVGARQTEYRNFSHDVYELQTATKNYNHQVGIGNVLEEERLKLMERLGIKFDDLEEKTTGTTGTPEGTPEGTDIINAERLKNDALLFIKQQFLQDTKELELKDDVAQLASAEDLAAQLQDIERKYFTDRLANLQVGSDEYISLKAQQAEYELQLELDLLKRKKKVFDSEKEAKEELELAKVQAVAKGASIIGSLASEGSALAKAAFIVEQGAAVADVIITGQKEIAAYKLAAAKQDILVPFSGQAMFAPLIAKSKIGTAMSVATILAQTITGLGSGGGGGSQQELSGEMYEQGGLTRGGMFVGNSHANGGVKFRVGGRIHEAEGGEAIINKKSTSMFRPVLSAINSYNGNGVKFADGGLLNSGEKFAMGGELSSAQQLISGGMGTSKVVIVESDMTDVQNRISAIESQATF